MRRSDSLPPFPPRFGSPRKGGTALRSLSRSRDCRALLATGQGFGGPVSPRPVFPAGTTEPPRFLGNPLCPCPALRPRWDLHARPFTAFRCGLPCFRRRRLPPQTPFGAPSHGLVTRCLRFAAWVAPGQRKTRFRLLAKLCRAGLVTRWVPIQGFRDAYISSPLSRLALAHRKSRLGARP
jgi:hypothetical protein